MEEKQGIEVTAGQMLVASGVQLSTEVTLLFPIEVEGVKRSKVTIRRSKVIDHKNAKLRAAGEDSASYELQLFSILTNLPPEVFDGMDYADYLAIQKAYSGFLSFKATA